MAKKLTAFLFLTCFIFISACSQGPQLLDFLNNGDTSESLGGITLYFKASLGPEDATKPLPTDTYLGYLTNTNFADLAKARVAQVEKDLDVNIELSKEISSDETFFDGVIYLLATGGGKLDVNIGMGYEDFSMSSLKDALVPMSEVSDYIDIYDSAKWGSPERLEMFAWDGEIYGVIPNYWPELQFASSDFILVPNINYIKSIGQEDPRDYFENGVWTLDKLEELIPIYARPSSNADEVVYGYSANERHLYELLVQYYGADWAQKDANGAWEAGALSVEGRQAAQKLRDYWAGDLSEMIYFSNVGDQEALWVKNQVAISTMHVATLTNAANKTVSVGYEYGVLPFPSQDGKSIFGQFERNVEAIFITSFSNYPDAAAKVVSAIYEPFEGYEDMDALREVYNSSIFFDERDTEIVFKLTESLRVLPQEPRSSEINYAIAEALEHSEVSSVLDMYATQINTLLEEEFIPVKETMEKLFPGYND